MVLACGERGAGRVSKHCPVTGELLTACECGACDLDDDGEGQDGSGRDEPS